jgi:hypothetical protein
MAEAKKDKNPMQYAGLASQWIIVLLLAVWGGLKADKYSGIHFPLFILLFPLLALIFLFWQLIKDLNAPGK